MKILNAARECVSKYTLCCLVPDIRKPYHSAADNLAIRLALLHGSNGSALKSSCQLLLPYALQCAQSRNVNTIPYVGFTEQIAVTLKSKFY